MKKLTLKEMQETELDLLVKFDRICRDNSFAYSLHGGTLLGAVRHKGFIPWDDDVDIWMPREDYEKFLAYCMNNKTDFKMVSVRNDRKYSLLYTRIYDDRTVVKGEHFIGLNKGLHIDIIPFDYIGKDLNYLQSRKRFIIKNIYWGLYKRNPLFHFLKKEHGIIRNLRTVFLYPLKYFLSNAYIEKRNLKPFEKFNYENSDYVCQLTTVNAYKRYYKKIIFDGYTDADFEGHKFKITKEYDYFLTKRYGDYMKLPPEEERHSLHTFEAYLKD